VWCQGGTRGLWVCFCLFVPEGDIQRRKECRLGGKAQGWRTQDEGARCERLVHERRAGPNGNSFCESRKTLVVGVDVLAETTFRLTRQVSIVGGPTNRPYPGIPEQTIVTVFLVFAERKRHRAGCLARTSGGGESGSWERFCRSSLPGDGPEKRPTLLYIISGCPLCMNEEESYAYGRGTT